MESLFIAIKLEATPKLIRLVRNTQVLMRKERIRWVPDMELHVKLASVNKMGMRDIDSVKNKLQEVVNGMSQFNTTIRGFGNMGSHSLWAGIDQNPEFLVLRQKINEVFAEYKEPDAVDFIPSILLARINCLHDKRLFFKIVDANRMNEFDDIRVKQICLVSCVLMNYGPKLERCASFALQEILEEELV
jgi:2'-5' RNA ligase